MSCPATFRVEERDEDVRARKAGLLEILSNDRCQAGGQDAEKRAVTEQDDLLLYASGDRNAALVAAASRG